MRYKQRINGEGFEVPHNQAYRLACCDCGLVHDFIFISQDSLPILVAATRNNRATAQYRRNKVITKAVSEVLHGEGRSKKEKVRAGSSMSQAIRREEES